MTHRIGLLLIVLLAFAGEAIADQIVLKNGDRLTGTIVKSDGKTIVFKSDLVGEVVVAMDNVQDITADKPLYLTLTDGRLISGLVTTKANEFEIKSSKGPVVVERAAVAVVRSEDEQKAYESTLNPGWFEQWSGGADLGFALTRGNSSTTNLALGMNIARETLHDKTTLYAASVYNRENTNGISRTVANTFRFGARYDRNINRDWFGYGFSDLEHNGLQELNLRWVLGGGIGYHAIKSERTKLDLLAGLDMSREFFEGNDNDRTSLEAQLGQTLDHRITPRLHLPGGFKQNDLLLTTGLKVKLGTIK